MYNYTYTTAMQLYCCVFHLLAIDDPGKSSLKGGESTGGESVNGNAKQKHPGYKKCGANKKQPYLCATKRFDIS